VRQRDDVSPRGPDPIAAVPITDQQRLHQVRDPVVLARRLALDKPFVDQRLNDPKRRGIRQLDIASECSFPAAATTRICSIRGSGCSACRSTSFGQAESKEKQPKSQGS